MTTATGGKGRWIDAGASLSDRPSSPLHYILIPASQVSATGPSIQHRWQRVRGKLISGGVAWRTWESNWGLYEDFGKVSRMTIYASSSPNKPQHRPTTCRKMGRAQRLVLIWLP